MHFYYIVWNNSHQWKFSYISRYINELENHILYFQIKSIGMHIGFIILRELSWPEATNHSSVATPIRCMSSTPQNSTRPPCEQQGLHWLSCRCALGTTSRLCWTSFWWEYWQGAPIYHYLVCKIRLSAPIYH